MRTHPYTWFKISSPSVPVPSLNNPDITPDSPDVGIDGIPAIEQEVLRLYREGALRTPGGRKPTINFDEFAMMSEGSDSQRNIPEEARATLAADFGCEVQTRDDVSGWSWYNLTSVPNSSWTSGLINSFHVITPTFFAVRDANLNHEECAPTGPTG
jgi:hypothetical protein